MAIRISQRQMYSNFLFNMNNNLSAYMNTHEQSSTQKKVNRPSDDPYGASQIMASYSYLNSIEQHKDNLSMAKGWITQGEGALAQVQNDWTSVITVMQQAATGTYNEGNRETMAFQLRQTLEQMISYANTKFNGRYIFAGHKTDSSPFEMTMGANSRDAEMSDVRFSVTGESASTVLVQFTQTDTLGNQPSFRYSSDSGKTWTNGTWSGTDTLVCGDVDVKMHAQNLAAVQVNAQDTTSDVKDGTWVYVRPAVEYKGDTNDPVVVQSYPYNNDAVTGTASGVFKRDVAVRIDKIAGGNIEYSYSTDDGVSWTSSTAADTPPRKLAVAGGFLELDNQPQVGSQFIIRPHRADIELTIGTNASIVVNNVGVDIFGGLFTQDPNGEPLPYPDNVSKNMFEALGQAIGFLESNSQSGAQEILDLCLAIDEHIGQARTTMGARLNRIESVKYQLDSLQLDENDRLSSLEDADLAEVMVKLSQQEIAYKSVLQSSSMIMQISLLNYL